MTLRYLTLRALPLPAESFSLTSTHRLLEIGDWRVFPFCTSSHSIACMAFSCAMATSMRYFCYGIMGRTCSGSDLPILTKFSGIGPLDRLLTLGGILFHSLTSGISPHVSLYAFQFSGQLVPVLMILLIEGGRRGNRTGIGRTLSS